MKIDPSIYLSSSNQDDEVITFGKSPKQELEDHSNGVARLGGKWRQPNYAKAYLRAARILVDEAKEKQDFDQLAMPIFYLQRHALELLIKSFLESLYEISDLRGNSLEQVQPLERLSKSHILETLNKDLKQITALLEIETYPIEIEFLVDEFKKYEKYTTFSRYPSSPKKDSKAKNIHLLNEITIPILDIQEKLQSIFSNNCHQSDEVPDSFEATIYYEWCTLTRALD